METLFKMKLFKRNKKFKSYYVVWKPPRPFSEEQASHEFKSYYVVWKLQTAAQKALQNSV